MIAAAVGASVQCGAIDLAKENWKVPNWSIERLETPKFCDLTQKHQFNA